MELAFANAKLRTDLLSIKFVTAMQFKEMADEVGSMTMAELALFFSGIGNAP